MKLTPNPEPEPEEQKEICPIRKGGECVRNGNQYHYKCAWYNDDVCDVSSMAYSLDRIARTLEELLKRMEPPVIVENFDHSNVDLRPGKIVLRNPRPFVEDEDVPF